jgi:hypothetical protein
MNIYLKSILYPLAVLSIFVIVIILDYLLTFFFSLVFNTTIGNVANSPMVIIYVISVIYILYASINVCQSIYEQ